jgi:periplasmic protein TonB
MQIETLSAGKSWFFRTTVIISVLVHAVAWAALTKLGTRPISESKLVQIVSDPNIKRPTPPPTPTPPKATPKPTPPPKKELAPPNQKTKIINTEPVKEIFGVTKDSVVGDSSVAVRVGNTLMKEQEKDFTDPSNVKPYSAPPKPVKVSAPPKLKKMVAPDYPSLARKAGKEGRVVLKVLISAAGHVVSVNVVKASPSGFGFEQSALAAVKKWRYSAPGQGRSVWFYQPIRFTLEN